ncbi:MAG TPA: DUF692 family protein [Pyrinomonadaceae bacterium]|jgi:hypothetical protein
MNRPPPVPKLGIGLLYQEQLRPFIERERDCFDFLELIPDVMWADMGYEQSPRFVENQEGIGFIRRVHAEMPVILHSIGFSIGSAHRFDREHIEQIARWYDWLKFPWHSDHLAFMFAEHMDGEINAGVTLPLPYDEESLDLLAPRIAEMRARVPVPFLLENNVYFFKYAGQDFDEPTFLNRLCQMSGSRLLLDLHNLYTNCRNHSTDPYEFLDQLDLRNVLEIHVAGGLEMEGFYFDAHSGISPPEVWQLLEWTLPRCPNLGGVTFEMLGSWFVDVGTEGLRAQLSRMKEAWLRHKPAPQATPTTVVATATTAEAHA